MNIRTDLAIEANEIYTESHNKPFGEGVKVEEEKNNSVKITRVHITDKNGEKALGKPCGSYVTLEIPDIFHEHFDIDEIAESLSLELSNIVSVKKRDSILVVGLGNRRITADSLGPKVTDSVFVTRHLFSVMPELLAADTRSVSALSPGVLGITGIETNEIVRGVVENVKPSFIIAIDSLASRRMSRVVTTIQIANTGITPGAGLGNNRQSISFENLGVPVIAIGVPTVVDAATMANDTIDLVIDSLIKNTESNHSFYSLLKKIDKQEKENLISHALNLTDSNMVVTPKDMDEIIDKLSDIIAKGINLSLNRHCV